MTDLISRAEVERVLDSLEAVQTIIGGTSVSEFHLNTAIEEIDRIIAAIRAIPAQGEEVDEVLAEVPEDPWKAFAYFVSRCAGGLGGELMAQGKTETEARNTVIGCFLSMAAGEACRAARAEGREPDPEKWRAATGGAFERAVKYTATSKKQEEDQK